jgi:hypothetical protein
VLQDSRILYVSSSQSYFLLFLVDFQSVQTYIICLKLAFIVLANKIQVLCIIADA